MNPKALARRADVELLATVVLTVAVVAALLVHYGLPLWLLPVGATPVGSFGLASWLVYRHDTRYTVRHSAIDAARLYAAEDVASIQPTRITVGGQR